MKSRRSVMRKARNDYPVRKQQRMPGRKQRLLSERSALIVTMALLAAAGSAGLLHAADQPVPMIVFTTVGVFVGALRLFSDLIG